MESGRSGKMSFAGPSDRQRGFSLIEVLIAAVVMILLSAIVIPTVFSWIEDGKTVRAQKDAGALAAAMNRFFQDTTRWPGQAEILLANSSSRFLIVGDPSTAIFPNMTGFTSLGAVTCTSGLAGVTPNVTAFTAATPGAGNTLNINDFLVRKPSATDYPNWRGPYINSDIGSDPWGRAWVINVIPLFCGETVTTSNSGGAAGYAWILGGGANGLIQTNFTDAKLNQNSDDVGVNLTKLITRS